MLLRSKKKIQESTPIKVKKKMANSNDDSGETHSDEETTIRKREDSISMADIMEQMKALQQSLGVIANTVQQLQYQVAENKKDEEASTLDTAQGGVSGSVDEGIQATAPERQATQGGSIGFDGPHRGSQEFGSSAAPRKMLFEATQGGSM